MSDIIKLLPDHVANQIAAGEVIQRPASVVKELLENSIDAGSTDIKLLIKEGGKTFIQVMDNGKGMSPTDARMCWERHATSKISQTEDIYQIKTMGFRGEALASIASVAQVELKTKRAEDNVGTLILIEGTEVKKQEPAALANGTAISVRNLFYNIPARRNFLKSNPVETRHIIDEFSRVALANPNIAFSMYNNDEEVYALKVGTLEQRIEQMFTYRTFEHILAADEQTTIINVNGFIGKPEISRKTRGEQFFFVNGRFIKDAYLNHAVVNCYENLISKEQFPFYVLHISIEPSQIDVNVHPTKTEIKFEDERAVYQIIRAVVKKALGQHYHVPTFEPASDDTFLNLTPNPTFPGSKQGLSQENTGRNGSKTPFGQNAFPESKSASKDWQELFSIMSNKETVGKSSTFSSTTEQQLQVPTTESYSVNIFQLHNSLIFSQTKSGVMIIDQQAAHERILYEKYLQALSNHPIASQQKLFPKSVSFSPADAQLLKEMMGDMRALGFDINELGGNTFAVNGVPAEISNQHEMVLLAEMLENYKQQSFATLNRHERIARSLAQKASIRKGTKLTLDEIKNLIDELFACAQPNYAPDGRACVVTMKSEDLFAMFK
ncbi:MAG: DNA mismatch repair endonuclease MutL [Bacteroidota bacterium]|jgi:DNA mismatch repair protein MutL